MGSQEVRHVLDGNIVNSHVGEISFQVGVILEIILALVGVRYIPRVRERAFHKPTGATGGIKSDL